MNELYESHDPRSARCSIALSRTYEYSSLQFPHNPKDYKRQRGFYSVRPDSAYYSKVLPASTDFAEQKSHVEESMRDDELVIRTMTNLIADLKATISEQIETLSQYTKSGPAVEQVGMEAENQTRVQEDTGVEAHGDEAEVPVSLQLSQRQDEELADIKMKIQENRDDISALRSQINMLSSSLDNESDDSRRASAVTELLRSQILKFKTENERYQQHLVELVEIRILRTIMNGSQEIKDKVRQIKEEMGGLDGGIQRLCVLADIMMEYE